MYAEEGRKKEKNKEKESNFGKKVIKYMDFPIKIDEFCLKRYTLIWIC